VVFKLDAPISDFAFRSILASALVLPKHLDAGKDIATTPRWAPVTERRRG
jgi:hypothetical protein